MKMIEVNVRVLPEGTRRRARIDPSAPFEKIKADMVKAIGLGDPDEYEMSISPKLTRLSYQSLRPSPGDLLILIRKEDLIGSSVELLG